MISKNQIKKIASLGQKKQRDLHQLFVVEGTKSVLDVCSNLKAEHVYATQEWCETNADINFAVKVVSEEVLKKLSQLKTPQGVIAVFSKIGPIENKTIDLEGLVLALDEIRDPGNLGTIIRLSDWFGVGQVLCSKGCADVYNPKVIQATMGSISRVHVNYVNLEEVLSEVKIPVFGTFMNGVNVYQSDLPKNAIVVMGNEGKGISSTIEALIQNKLSIPSFSQDGAGAESLNVSIATAIICSEFKRSM